MKNFCAKISSICLINFTFATHSPLLEKTCDQSFCDGQQSSPRAFCLLGLSFTNSIQYLGRMRSGIRCFTYFFPILELVQLQWLFLRASSGHLSVCNNVFRALQLKVT